MKAVACVPALAVAVLCAAQVQAQTADEIVERHLTAAGGRAALAKLESRIERGTISVSMQEAQIGGVIEAYSKAPAKSRMYARLDLTQFGMGEVIVDQRCDGKTAFVSNTMEGDRELTGNQLQATLNGSIFPTELLNYKDAGGKVELVGKDRIGERAAYVVKLTPKAGPPSTYFFDAESYQELRRTTTIDVPQMGGETQQTVDFSDYRDVDGVKVPFAQTIVNAMQTITVTLQSVEHNKPIDDAMFSKPVAK